MPNPTDPADVERALKATGNGWILEMVEPAPLLKQVAMEVDEFLGEYTRRFGRVPEPFALVDQNPDKAAAFFELYTNPPVSMDMRLAVWQLVHGANILSVRFVYERDRETEVVITAGTRKPSRDGRIQGEQPRRFRGHPALGRAHHRRPRNPRRLLRVERSGLIYIHFF